MKQTYKIQKSVSEMDKSYSWVLVAVCSFSYMILTGTTKTFGVLYAAIIKRYGTGAGNTAWVGSLLIFFMKGLGPLSNHLCITNTFGRVMFAGGLVSSFGYLITFFVSRTEWMYLTIGVVIGVGNGLQFTTVLTIVNYYVEERRAFANGLIVAGSGVGVFIFPYLYRYLINKYGLHGSFMVLSGVVLHVCIAATMFRQPKILLKKRRTIQHLDKDDSKKEARETDLKDENVSRLKRSFLDFSVFCVPSFTVFSIVFMLQEMSFGCILLMLFPHINDLGYSNEEADFVMSLIGIGDIFSRILYGWIADKACIRKTSLLSFTVTVSGVLAIAISFMDWYPVLIFYSISVGTFTSSYLSVISVITIDIVGIERFPPAIGKINFLLAVCRLVGSPISGWLKDSTGSWLVSFRFAGCLSIIAGILATLNPLINKYSCCHKSNKPDGISSTGVTKVAFEV